MMIRTKLRPLPSGRITAKKALYFMGFFNLIYLIMAGALSVAMLLLNIRLFFKPSERNAWIVFKFSSPYLALIFIAMMLDRLIQL
ncbi:MAG: hypothetical protein H3Z52_13810 [archaeon]|nr:hypothetical protein [archaeon]MCP8321990.1 hypothetical protein [archaeon]